MLATEFKTFKIHRHQSRWFYLFLTSKLKRTCYGMDVRFRVGNLYWKLQNTILSMNNILRLLTTTLKCHVYAVCYTALAQMNWIQIIFTRIFLLVIIGEFQLVNILKIENCEKEYVLIIFVNFLSVKSVGWCNSEYRDFWSWTADVNIACISITSSVVGGERGEGV